MLAGDLIEEARDYNEAFHRRFGGSKAPFRRLSRLAHTVAADLAGEYPEALAVANTIASATLATALAGTGVLTVPAYITILDPIYGDLKDSSGGGFWRVHQIPRSQQYKGGAPFPSVALSDEALHLTDLRRIEGTEHGWEDIEQLRYDYVPLPIDADNEWEKWDIPLPDGLGGYLVASLAVWMATRLKMRQEAQDLAVEREVAMSSFLSTVALQGRGTTWHVLDEA